MNELPAHIADMCGLVMNKPENTSQDIQEKYDNPIQWTEEGDGTFTLTYFGKIVGWMNKTKLDRRDGLAYRAVSIHGDVRLCWSERMARDWLLERYH
jgi:hypothetical protein